MAVWIAIYSVLALHLAAPVTDNDIWWHLRTGHWICAHGTVPTTDPFSGAAHGERWYAYSWLFEVLVYGLYNLFGLIGVAIVRGALSLGTMIAVHRLISRRETRFLRRANLVGLALISLVPVLSERSWLFSIFFYVLTLEVVLRFREGKAGKACWLLPLCFAVWVNVHIQFVNGLLLLGLACVAPVFDLLLRRRDADLNTHTAVGSQGWNRLVALTMACLVATLCNPYGLGIYLPVFELPTQSGAFRLIAELQSLTFRYLVDWAVLTLLGLAAFKLGQRPKISSFELILLVSSAFLSFRSRRDVWLVVFAAIAILVSPRSAKVEQPTLPRMGRWRWLGVAVAVTVALFLSAWGRGLTNTRLEEKVADTFPAQAAAVVEQRGYSGPLYNSYAWGGYLTWRLPNLPVCMDGRANLYGDTRMERSMAAWGGLPGWDSDPELRKAGVVIAEVKAPLTSLLRLDPRFQVTYEDSVAVVFIAKAKSK